MEASGKINAAMLRIMQVKQKHLREVVTKGQQLGLFTPALTAEELIHIIMGSFRLQMFKWRVADFQSDIRQQGAAMLRAIISLISQ